MNIRLVISALDFRYGVALIIWPAYGPIVI